MRRPLQRRAKLRSIHSNLPLPKPYNFESYEKAFLKILTRYLLSDCPVQYLKLVDADMFRARIKIGYSRALRRASPLFGRSRLSVNVPWICGQHFSARFTGKSIEPKRSTSAVMMSLHIPWQSACPSIFQALINACLPPALSRRSGSPPRLHCLESRYTKTKHPYPQVST